MKSPSSMTDECDDIFGPPRTYATGFCTPKQRPSMISAKYRAKEERRKVLKISINKLKKIDDPEASLCRSVLINNTMKRLQKEARDEKVQKQQLNYPRCYDNDSFLNIKTEFMKNELKGGTPVVYEDVVHTDYVVAAGADNDDNSKIMESLSAADFVVGIDAAEVVDMTTVDTNAKNNLDVLDGLVEENLNKLEGYSTAGSESSVGMDVDDGSSRFSSRKRSFDDMEDCDVQDVLSQFYMPPTPRMLTCIDDDEDVNGSVADAVVVVEPSKKKHKCDETLSSSAADSSFSSSTSSSITTSSSLSSSSVSLTMETATVVASSLTTTATSITNSSASSAECDAKKHLQEDFRLNYSALNNNNNNNISEATDARLARYLGTNGPLETETNSYSCGHASMFNELQNNVFHNLIASLET